MESQHVKSINIDKRSTKRIKFASAKERAKRASADVYRSHKRKIGATSATTREEAVHNPRRENSARKRQRSHHLAVGDDKEKTAVLKISKGDDKDDKVSPDLEPSEDRESLDVSSSLAEELDETLDRNASEIFGKFHRHVWPLVRSLPEILHHSEKIVDLMLSHMLSPESYPERPSYTTKTATDPRGYIVNHATLDILHLMAVLARDLRHEIHPYLDRILARIIQDLLNPPPPPPESGKQPIPLDVTLVEAAFRSISYVFRYDTDRILENIEVMRKYYGSSLAAKRELTRRLAAETFAPLLRKLKIQTERQRHLKRVFKALVAATGGKPTTPQLKRTQEDAVNGISQLIFQIVRGVPGRLHSQGPATVQFVLSYCTKPAEISTGDETMQENKNVLLSIASSFLDHLCRHVDGKTYGDLVSMLCDVLKASFAPAVVAKSGFQSTLNALRLLSNLFGANRATWMTTLASERRVLYGTLDRLFASGFIDTQSFSTREGLVSLLCPIWLVLQGDDGMEQRLGAWLDVIFSVDDKDMSEEKITTIRNITDILSRHLIPKLTNQGALDKVGSTTLAGAARLANFDNDAAILTVFALASKHFDDDTQCDEVYSVPGETQEELVGICLVDFDAKTWDSVTAEKLAIALRCVPFLAALPREHADNAVEKRLFKKSAAWYVDMIVHVGKTLMEEEVGDRKRDKVWILSLAFEGLARLTAKFLETFENPTVESFLRKVIGTADRLLFSYSSSMWAIRGVAALVNTMSKLNMRLEDRVDVFDALLTNLSSPSHAMRLNTLKILASYPMKNFVADHADLDLDGDLDEDPSFQPGGNDSERSRGPVGKCDLISVLLQIEQTKVKLSEERHLLGLVSKVEALGRSGKLPVVYAESAAHHMLGLFYVKFAPLWPAARRALVALTKGHESAAWPALEAKLVNVMRCPSESGKLDDSTVNGEVIGFCGHRLACIEWEESQGRSISAFDNIPPVEDGEVYRHLTTDESTVMETVWGVAEKCQEQVAKHSRVIVPTFLEFLTDQFYFFHADDPSARELRLNKPSKDSR